MRIVDDSETAGRNPGERPGAGPADRLAQIECDRAALCALVHDLETEITRRRQLELEMAGLREQCTLAARQAGMAEVATGALHNVGNVLNSINVSASLMDQRLRQSRIHNLVKALGLIHEHRGDLAGFFASDPKGQMLPGYLETLADHLVAEQTELVREMSNLTRNVEHVKEIVAVQQSYARQCGVLETLPVSDLVQDAIRMNLGAFERHGIRIEREFAAAPPVTVDRHKVLQILINLMRNAKYAMDESGQAAKVLTVGIAAREDRVIISVRDSGVGIAPENLSRIFAHGFTTKRDGHGFGLHSGAQAAKEMGGRLTGASDGLGKGATFCLELPVARVKPEGDINESGTRSSNGPMQR